MQFMKFIGFDLILLTKKTDSILLSCFDIGMEQKRNAYAVSVWRRIRMKLEGTVYDLFFSLFF